MKELIFFLGILIYILSGCSQNNNHLNEHEGHEDSHQGYEDTLHAESPDNTSDQVHDEDEHDEGYGIAEIKEQPFYEIIRTSGEILSAQGDEVTLTAMHDGVVVFNEKQLFGGKNISKGESLLSISGEALIHDNIESSYLDIKSAFEKAQSNYERSLELNKDKIISDKELLDIKLEYDKAQNQFDLLKRNYSGGGQKLSAPISGFIKDVFVTEGQYVVTGQLLLKISKNKRLVIKADVPQRYFHMLENIHSANFITVYDKKLYDIKDLNGRLISYGKTSEANSLFTPVYFEVDNKGSLLSGAFVEVFLKTIELPRCIVVPKTALLEESGRYYVYVENDDQFEKRFVTIDCNDGMNYHITEGIKQGEHIVTKNPYRVKLSALSTTLPAHSGHSH